MRNASQGGSPLDLSNPASGVGMFAGGQSRGAGRPVVTNRERSGQWKLQHSASGADPEHAPDIL